MVILSCSSRWLTEAVFGRTLCICVFLPCICILALLLLCEAIFRHKQILYFMVNFHWSFHATLAALSNPVTRVSNGYGEVQVWYSREIDPCPPCRASHRPWTVGVPHLVGECVRHCSMSTHQAGHFLLSLGSGWVSETRIHGHPPGGALFTVPEWWVDSSLAYHTQSCWF